MDPIAQRSSLALVERRDTSQPQPAKRLLRLPCAVCGSYYYTDEPSCPVCEYRRYTKRQVIRLLRLPCAVCGSYYYDDEPRCPVCEYRQHEGRQSVRPPTWNSP